REVERIGGRRDDPRPQAPLADRSAGVRADVAEGVDPVAVPADDADLDAARPHHRHAPVREPLELADRCQPPFQPKSSIALSWKTLRCQASGMLRPMSAMSSVSQCG